MKTLVKAEIRPLLVQELARAERAEELAYLEVKGREHERGWKYLAVLDEQWRAARLRRAQAELQLWLADRQWEREEQEEYLKGREAALKTTSL